jgi:hypothetical protein
VTPEQWRRVRDLFEQAIERPVLGMDRWVADQAQDPTVAAEVLSLLDHHSRAGAFLEGSVAPHVAGLLEEEPAFDAGEMVGPYRIEAEVGRGGMGRVYLATDTRLGRKVALKALAPRFVRDGAQRARLRNEAQAAASLTHPGICTIYALEEIGDDVFIAAEYVDGLTLRDEMTRGTLPAAGTLLDTARDLAAALALAHARGITHRDLKPENVMRTASGTLKIVDFGLALVSAEAASMESPRVTTPGTLVGTPAYMAPEQLNGGTVDPRTDVFALGVVLYEYATGAHPFAAATPLAVAARILESEPCPVSELRHDLPPLVGTVVHRCLRKSPNERFAHAGEVALALGGSGVRATGSALGWWRTHMATSLALYFVAAAIGWLVKEWDHGYAQSAFVLLAMAATVGGVFRGHLLFAERTHRRETFLAELRRSAPVLLTVDLLIAAVLVLEGLWVSRNRSVAGVLILGLGIGIALARLVLEHSTTRAAFDAAKTH